MTPSTDWPPAWTYPVGHEAVALDMAIIGQIAPEWFSVGYDGSRCPNPACGREFRAPFVQLLILRGRMCCSICGGWDGRD